MLAGFPWKFYNKFLWKCFVLSIEVPCSLSVLSRLMSVALLISTLRDTENTLKLKIDPVSPSGWKISDLFVWLFVQRRGIHILFTGRLPVVLSVAFLHFLPAGSLHAISVCALKFGVSSVVPRNIRFIFQVREFDMATSMCFKLLAGTRRCCLCVEPGVALKGNSTREEYS